VIAPLNAYAPIALSNSCSLKAPGPVYIMAFRSDKNPRPFGLTLLVNILLWVEMRRNPCLVLLVNLIGIDRGCKSVSDKNPAGSIARWVCTSCHSLEFLSKPE